MAASRSSPTVRGTQLLVEHIGSVFRRPSLVAIEVAWRWLFGIPLLMICWQQGQRLLTAFPLESSGAGDLNWQDPWIASRQVATIFAYYQPHLLGVLRWLFPVAALVWIVISGFGRGLLLYRMVPGSRFRPITAGILQAAWLCLFGLTLWCWYSSMSWVAATHIPIAGEPDLIGYFIWAIFLSLGFFTAWALLSWTVTIAPLLAVLETCSAAQALVRSVRLGKAFSGKLAEVNLVLGIVKLALVVLAMVFSAAPLPFSDALGPDAMHVAGAGAILFFILADHLFQVVRLKAFLEFWEVYRAASPK